MKREIVSMNVNIPGEVSQPAKERKLDTPCGENPHDKKDEAQN